MDPQAMQQMEQLKQASEGMGAGMTALVVLLALAAYLFGSYCWARLAKKTGMPFGSSFIWALIPIANIFLGLKIAGKPWWWFIMFIIPIVNIVFLFLYWMALCERFGKPAWWGVVMILVPVVNLILFLMLVFEDTQVSQPTA